MLLLEKKTIKESLQRDWKIKRRKEKQQLIGKWREERQKLLGMPKFENRKE